MVHNLQNSCYTSTSTNIGAGCTESRSQPAIISGGTNCAHARLRALRCHQLLSWNSGETKNILHTQTHRCSVSKNCGDPMNIHVRTTLPYIVDSCRTKRNSIVKSSIILTFILSNLAIIHVKFYEIRLTYFGTKILTKFQHSILKSNLFYCEYKPVGPW